MADAELKKLKSSRGGIQHRVTNIRKYLEETFLPSEVKIVSDLKVRLELLDTCKQSYDELQVEILFRIDEVTDADEWSKQATKGDEFVDMYLEVKSLIMENIKLIEVTPIVPATPTGAFMMNHRAVKLPTITLPIFDGSYEKWINFQDTFQSLIHESDYISKIEKFHYLKSSLTGEALSLIQSIEVSTDNYDVAYELLKERFTNKKLLVKKHIQSLFDLMTVHKESSSCLRKLLDSTTTNLRILKKLGQPTEHWDALVVHFVTSKFDQGTRKEWESSSYVTSKENDTATVKDLTTFLQDRCTILESLESHHSSKGKSDSSSISNIKVNSSSRTSSSSAKVNSNSYQSSVQVSEKTSINRQSSTDQRKCSFCSENHSSYSCSSFLKLPIADRLIKVRELRLCFNCLCPGHSVISCQSTGRCRTCNKLHHTLLHFVDNRSTLHQNCGSNSVDVSSTSGKLSVDSSSSKQSTSETTGVSSHVNHSSEPAISSQVFLSTAVVVIKNQHGDQTLCRMLLDSGSQSNFITEDLCQRLKLKRENVHIPLCGISESQSTIKNMVNATIKSRHSGFEVNLNFLVLSKITGELPSVSVDSRNWGIPSNIELADESFNKKGKIDLLVGAEVFYQILCIGHIVLSDSIPSLQKTLFGWIVSGKLQEASSGMSNSYFSSGSNRDTPSQNDASFCNHAMVITNLHEDLSKFWEIEELASESSYTKEEENCEAIFKSTTYRNDDGKFVVKLPVNDKLDELGESYQFALKRFYCLERRLQKQPELHHVYKEFISEYYKLSHMREVTNASSSKLPYYMPHHAVIKPSSTSTKCRVVFDASMKSSSGISLNNVLMVGPTVQSDLLSIMLRFRFHKIVMVADITKMYRQIEVDESDVHLQRILWRSSMQEDIKSYELTTVTYGTSSAPFLATRCLNQIAIEISESHPVESNIILKDFYVDDLMTGATTVEDALKIQVSLLELCKRYGFDLRKWCSNSEVVVNNVPEDFRETSSTLRINDKDTVKTLGLLYQPGSDMFRFSIHQEVNISDKVTKRTILSEIAKIFDPLGLVGPVITSAKIFMQVLWQLKLNWDESLPQSQYTQWFQNRSQLVKLNELQIQRCVLPVQDVKEVEIHGFCDASQSAYGACIYVRSSGENDENSVMLLCSKSRVAPLKTISIPRLELCGALLLAKLVKSVVTVLDVKISKIFLWTDSTIVLYWLRGDSSSLKTFVSNRVGEIQRLTDVDQWNHVAGSENPADLISRGCSAETLIQSKVWWYGPEWLIHKSMPQVSLETEFEKISSDIMEKKNKVVSLVSSQVDNWKILDKYSSLTRLKRIIAYCLRFIHHTHSRTKPITNELSVEELRKSEVVLIKLSQQRSFNAEISDLKKNGQVNRKSKLLSLVPFLGENDLVNVGGRLQKSSLTEGQKHPLVLSSSCNLTKLIFKHYHESHLHAGPQALLSAVRQKFWPVGGKNLARQTVFNCIRCFKSKPKSITHIMGSLPEHRVQPTLRPFVNTGIDYAGPFLTHRGGRSQVKIKSYVALFVCFATKAVHLELVSDLTSESFIAALRRFIGRRGKCLHLYSDNATNFVGANRELKELRDLFISQQFNEKVTNSLTSDDISWHFIPPRSPHFGGLWEAGVKSAKTHLKKVLGSSILTFEELNTVLIQIEAVLNSRPLTSFTNDPNDLRALTPGHFIIGDSLTSIPEPDLSAIPLNRLSRWQKVQKLQQEFWSRWSKEYLPELQERTKWKINASNIKIGTLVLMKEDNIPSFKWPLGRVIEVHAGSDEVVRVVTLKTATGTFKRAVQKVCPFPEIV